MLRNHESSDWGYEECIIIGRRRDRASFPTSVIYRRYWKVARIKHVSLWLGAQPRQVLSNRSKICRPAFGLTDMGQPRAVDETSEKLVSLDAMGICVIRNFLPGTKTAGLSLLRSLCSKIL
jgi:hypothetical protein